MKLIYKIQKDDSQKSIHHLLVNKLNLSTRLLNKLIKYQKITLNQEKCDTRKMVQENDVIEIYLDLPEDNSHLVPTPMELTILYEDEWFLVVNKPAGIPVHPSLLHYTDSLSNGIKYYFDTIKLAKKIRPVNRLDLDTSGLVIFAKCEYIQESFIQQMANHTFKKEYLGLVEGILENKNTTINLPIGRKNDSIIERCVDFNRGQPSITHYHVIKEFQKFSLVSFQLPTGRTHQIRVHMASIGHSLLGDTLYGKASSLIKRQALHSYRISCIHPISKKSLTFETNLPNDISSLLDRKLKYLYCI